MTKYDISFEAAIEQIYGRRAKEKAITRTHEVTWTVERIYIQKAIQKAIQRKPFFQFSNLKNYVPSISSMKTFIESPDFLGRLTLNISLPVEVALEDINPVERLKMVEKFFKYMEENIR